MDANQTNVTTAPQGAINPQPPPSVVQPPQESGENNKMVLWLIVGLVVTILLVGGIYLYLSGQKKPSPPTGPAASPTVQENLENELNSLTIEDLDAEFQVIDKDLESL